MAPPGHLAARCGELSLFLQNLERSLIHLCIVAASDPLQDDLQQGHHDMLWNDLLEAGRAGGFSVEEAAPAWVSGDEYRLSPVDAHPNAAGHQRLAEALARDLRGKGMLLEFK